MGINYQARRVEHSIGPDPEGKALATSPNTLKKKRRLIKASKVAPKKPKLLASTMPVIETIEICY